MKTLGGPVFSRNGGHGKESSPTHDCCAGPSSDCCAGPGFLRLTLDQRVREKEVVESSFPVQVSKTSLWRKDHAEARLDHVVFGCHQEPDLCRTLCQPGPVGQLRPVGVSSSTKCRSNR